MKRFCFLLFSLAFLFVSCSSPGKRIDGNRVATIVEENRNLLMQCVEEMEKMGEERIYVAMEQPKSEEGEEEISSAVEPRLVSYEKESGDRTEIANPALQEALECLGLQLIFFQTAADSRRCVIFSFQKESEKSVQGFYYSYDTLPCGWWGRKADLERRDGRYFSANQKGDAWYYTLSVAENFYYFEKNGSLLA